MKTCTVKVRYAGNGYTARAGRGKAAATASATSDPATAAQRAAAKFFGVEPSKVETSGRFTHDEGGTYNATLADSPAPAVDAEAPSAPAMDIAGTFFDESIRIDTIIWLAAQGDQPTEAFEDFCENCGDDRSVLAIVQEKLGLSKKAWLNLLDEGGSEAMSEVMSRFARRRVEGFLVQASTPVPHHFHEDGNGFMHYGFGHCTLQWFYTDALDAAFVERLVKWKESFIAEERKRHAAKAKKGGA